MKDQSKPSGNVRREDEVLDMKVPKPQGIYFRHFHQEILDHEV